MESASVKFDDYREVEYRCIVCMTQIAKGQLCEACERRGLDSRQFAELFWEEA
jgi:hypothetical protein